jgi:hypothetical protein
MSNENITRDTYTLLSEVYDRYNRALFDGRLPDCLLTLRAGRRCYGYFSPGRFVAETIADEEPENGGAVHEIALNPAGFARPLLEVFSTLVHEMAHLEQQVYGKPSRNGYHNAQWGTYMDRVGLTPSHDGTATGKRTGQNMTHYIVPGGAFDTLTRIMLASSDYSLLREVAQCAAKKKSNNKLTYQCPSCDAKAWGKAGLRILCEDCDARMQCSGEAEGDTDD